MTLTPTTRASLLHRLRDPQDHDAWVDFVDLYEPIAYRLFRRMGIQDADARELTQELFLIVSRNAEHWDPDRERGSFRGWLQRVARNLLINWLKHRDRRLIVSGGSELNVMLTSLPASPEQDTDDFNHEFRRAVFHRAAERVQGEVQIATWQAFWETAVMGKSTTEVAAQLKMTVGAVRVAKCRVLSRLQSVVREMEELT